MRASKESLCHSFKARNWNYGQPNRALYLCVNPYGHFSITVCIVEHVLEAMHYKGSVAFAITGRNFASQPGRPVSVVVGRENKLRTPTHQVDILGKSKQ